jgi:diacylglycerol kinase family enzyme
VRSVFDKAGVRYRVVETEHGGHARALLTAMPAAELAAYDGLVAIGGDGWARAGGGGGARARRRGPRLQWPLLCCPFSFR